MARYRKLEVKIWYDEKFSQLTSTQKLIAIYLLTGPQTNRIGFFCFSMGECAECLGLSPTGCRQGVGETVHALRWGYDETRRVVLIPNWFKYQPVKSLDTLKGYLQDLDEVPKTTLFTEFYRAIQKHAPIGVSLLGDPPPQGLGDPPPHQELELELELEQELEQERLLPTEVCTERSETAPHPLPEGSGFKFPVKSKTQKIWELSAADLKLYRETYPGVDVEGELRKAALWLQTNSSRRKTARGMLGFLTRWVGKANDHVRAVANHQDEATKRRIEYDRAMAETVRKRELREAAEAARAEAIKANGNGASAMAGLFLKSVDGESNSDDQRKHEITKAIRGAS